MCDVFTAFKTHTKNILKQNHYSLFLQAAIYLNTTITKSIDSSI